MGSEWRTVLLEELTAAPATYGVVQPGKDEINGIPMLRVNNFRGYGLDLADVMKISPETEAKYVRTRLKEGDVLITIVGSVGQVAIVPPEVIDWNIARAVAMIRPKEPGLSRWISLVLRSAEAQRQLGMAANTTVQTTINLKDLRQLRIPVPSNRERQRITDFLGALDDKIELNRKQNETLQAMARALFKSWFVDFEPVRAKMEGRWQRGQSLPGMPAHLYDLFPDRLVESELGVIPEGWEHIPFGALLESSIGGDWGKDVPEGDHSEVVSIIRGTDFPDVLSGGIGRIPTRYTTAKKLASRQLQAGDIVLETSGGSPTQPTGRSIFISESVLDRFSNAVVCASFCRRFHPKNRGLGVLLFMHLQYLYTTGGTWEYQNQSTGIANFQTTRFLESEMVVMPTAELLRVFSTKASSLLKKMSSNENLTLAKLRDSMLPKLISGEVRVKDTERFFEKVGLA